MTATYSDTTAHTRLIQLLFIALLLATSLATTGCGLVDSNERDEITIERVLVQEPVESIAGQMSDASQAAEDDDLGDPGTDNPVKNSDN